MRTPAPDPRHPAPDAAAGVLAPPGRKLRLPRVTACAIDGRNPGLALAALARSAEQVEFADALLVTGSDQPLPPPAPGIRVLRVAPIRSAAEYSRLIVRELGHWIDTDFALVLQWDGFVCNAAAWQDDFLDVDYIGAPWLDGAPGAEVGNGGFSLRSRRFLRAGQDQRLQDLHPEDTALCRQHRGFLEREHGVRFAPVELARGFAYENARPARPTFGFHGPYNLADHLPEPEMLAIVEALPAAFFDGRDGRRLLRSLVHRGYARAAARAGTRRLGVGRTDINTRALTAAARLLQAWQSWRPRR